MMLGKLYIHLLKNKCKTMLLCTETISAKWIMALNVRPHTLIVLEESKGQSSSIFITMGFLQKTLITQGTPKNLKSEIV